MDTDTRKFSSMLVSSPWRGICNVPSGAIDDPEKFSLVYLYNEFAGEEAAPATGVPGGSSVAGKFGTSLHTKFRSRFVRR